MDPSYRLAEAAFPIVVSGPSGAGKTVLCRELGDALPDLRRSISATTRPRRGAEEDGEAYFFWSRERFLTVRDQGGFAEWAEVHGQLYGTPKAWLDERLAAGSPVVLNIDVQGGLQLRASYPGALLVFVLPPSLNVLEARLRGRGTDPPAEIERRLRTAREEIGQLPKYDAVIINDRLDEATADLVAVVRAERLRTGRRVPRGWTWPPEGMAP